MGFVALTESFTPMFGDGTSCVVVTIYGFLKRGKKVFKTLKRGVV